MSQQPQPTKQTLTLDAAPETFAVSAGPGTSPGTLTGRAVVYNALSSDRGGYRVRFEPRSMRLPQGRDARALYAHDERALLGRVSNGTLRISEDEQGVTFGLDLPDTTAGRDVAELVRRGDLQGCSFGMFGLSHRWEEDDGIETKVYESWELDELTLTGNPAFTQTSVRLAPEDTTYGRMSTKNKTTDGAATPAETQADPRETFAQKKQEAEALAAKARDEGRGMSDDERQQFGSLKAELSAIRDNLAAERDLAELSIEQFAAEAKAVATAAHSPRIEVKGDRGDKLAREQFDRFLRTGEQFTVTTATDGGGILPKWVDSPHLVGYSIANVYEQAKRAAGSPLIETADSAQISKPVFDRSGRAAIQQPEGGSATEADPQIGSVLLGATLYSSKQEWYSRTEVAAMPSVIDSIEPELRQLIDARRESELTADLAANATAFVGSSATELTYGDFVAAKFALPAAYRRRRRAAWFLSSEACASLEGLADDTGRPIFVQPVSADAPATLLGMPVYEAADFAGLSAGNVVGAIASLDAIFIRTVTGGIAAPRIARYGNFPGRPDQIGFEMFANGDSGFATPGVRAIQLA